MDKLAPRIGNATLSDNMMARDSDFPEIKTYNDYCTK